MLISKIKKIISFSFLTLFLVSLVFPIASLAADPTLTLKLEKEDLNTQTDRWSWLISINTTNVPDNTSASVKLFKTIDAKTTEEESIIEKIINNQAVYNTKNTLVQGVSYQVNVRIGDKTATFSKTTGTESNSKPVIIYNTIIPTTENNTKTEENYYPLAPLPGVGETNCTQDNSNPPKTTCIKLGTQKCTTEGGVETCVPCGPTDKGCTPGTGFAGYLNMMIQIFIGIAAVLSMIMIVMGGIEYMTSELVSGKNEGKERITHAILGLILALGSYAILNTLNPDLLNVGLSKLEQATLTIDPETELAPWEGTSNLTSPTGTCKEGYTNITTYGSPTKINVCKSISENSQKMLAAAKKVNIILSGWGARTYDQQIDLRKKHKCPDIYTSPSNTCKPPTARPGHSKHESGKAIDFTCNGQSMEKSGGKNSVCFKWLSNNAKTYGLKNLASESWHWSDDGS
ncbi:MAG: D-alanyl-D-alanine carboxypeptidase family protein [Candidatus Paceibacterota bacterium]|jgi:hypothetical protein